MKKAKLKARIDDLLDQLETSRTTTARLQEAARTAELNRKIKLAREGLIEVNPGVLREGLEVGIEQNQPRDLHMWNEPLASYMPPAETYIRFDVRMDPNVAQALVDGWGDKSMVTIRG